MTRCSMLMVLVLVLVACGGEPTPTPDAVAAQIAIEKAAHVTMTAKGRHVEHAWQARSNLR
jgi:hypothetical protein